MAVQKKNSNISRDMKQLKILLNNIPKDRKPIAESIYNELLFMQKTLESLKEQIAEDGAVSMFKQGKQEFLREHPALKGYNTTIRNYSNLYKQFIDLLPPVEPVQEVDPLLEFIKDQ